VGFRADIRTAAATMLSAYAASASVKLQVYPGRPRSIAPPTAFVDRISETVEYVGPVLVQRTPRVEVVVLHGLFDTADTADQGDAFVDGFLLWVNNNVHAGGANTTVGVAAIEDEPNYVPDWQPPEQQKSYYASRITLEGFTEN
jgi:hypothetical protein